MFTFLYFLEHVEHNVFVNQILSGVISNCKYIDFLNAIGYFFSFCMMDNFQLISRYCELYFIVSPDIFSYL